MKNTIIIVGTLGDERMEFIIPDKEPRIHSHIRHMIEGKKDFETLQTLVSKNVILSKFGNMYKNLELLKAHNNIEQYTFKVDFAGCTHLLITRYTGFFLLLEILY